MGLFDKVKKLAEDHGDKLEGAVDKVAEVVDDKTGGKYSDTIESGAEAAKGFLGDEDGGGTSGGEEPPSRREP
jgi:ABC-type transporter Mla subunit MlaD